VAWQFDRKGLIVIDKASSTEDALMLATLEAGAQDIADHGETWQVVVAPTDIPAVEAALAEADIPVTSTDTAMVADQLVPLNDAVTAKSVLRVIDSLEEHDDIQHVFANFDIPDEILEDAYA
jgi:transcriptional/translational regulatory protein YebC/TACO1